MLESWTQSPEGLDVLEGCQKGVDDLAIGAIADRMRGRLQTQSRHPNNEVPNLLVGVARQTDLVRGIRVRLQ